MVLRFLTAVTFAPDCQAGATVPNQAHNDKGDSTSMQMTQEPPQAQPDTVPYRVEGRGASGHPASGVWGLESPLDQGSDTPAASGQH